MPIRNVYRRRPPAFRIPGKAIAKAEEFAAKNIAPNTDPFPGKAAQPKTKSTPAHYDVAADPKRGYMLAVALAHGKFREQGPPILNYALDHFPYGDRGQTGAHCAHDAASILSVL